MSRTDPIDATSGTNALCLMCWGNGTVMNRYRHGWLRRWTADFYPCPRCDGAGRVAS